MPQDDFDDLDLDEDFDDLDEQEEEETAKKKPAKKKAAPKGIGAAQVADKLGANPKTFRAWLRRKVDAGDLTISDHEAKGRYSWKNWKDPELVAIMKAWKADSHEKGGGKKADGKPVAKKKAATKKAATKKAPAKKSPTRRTRKTAAK